MTIIKREKRFNLIRCSCGNEFKQGNQGYDIAKCYACGTLGEVEEKAGMTFIKEKKMSLKYLDQTDQDALYNYNY